MAKKLYLEEEHMKLNPKFIEFAGWHMPLEYKGVTKEHLQVRTKAGIFDISHMGRIRIKGKSSQEFLQKITSNDINKLYSGKAQYSLILSPEGTILDDIIVYMLDNNEYLLVVNAGNKEKIISWMKENKSKDLEIEDESEFLILLALQGPLSESILQPLVKENLLELKYYHFYKTQIFETEVILSRTGYTGEDGFEIFIPNYKAKEFWKYFMENTSILPCGLGARDTLRIEMGYPLYGHEIDENTTPWEANLSFVVKLEKSHDFIGKKALIGLKDKRNKFLIAFELLENGIPRQGYGIFHNDEKIGWVTSGTFSPILKKGIGLGYLRREILEDNLEVEIRDKRVKIKIVKLPFVKNTSIKKGVR
ncbi:MAG: glycine cleavage system aminomethyltransferase GcvT [Dictyoglomaceae bacterium]|nr:glycine cleavage system aminomethyltransferase GcvT [Dictyoglomaceae bacterium]